LIGEFGTRVLERALGCGGIVAYHGVREASLLRSAHITPAALQAQLEFVAGSYDVVPLAEFVARRRNGKSLRRCVAITFDDAYSGVLTLGLPILERLRLPVTVFVASSFCRRGKRFWWDRFEWVVRRIDATAKAGLLRSVGLGDQAVDDEVRDRIITHFRGGLPRSLDAELRRAESQVGLVPERAMTGEELLRLARSELVDFGCHSAHHYALPWLAAPKAEKEIRLDHDWLRERLPRVRPYLAYPYGMYTRATVEAARRSGMEAAFSIEGHAATSRFPMYRCSRIGMADVNTVKGLRLRLSWITIPIVAARNRGWIAERAP
jgi:peptidoglycan/xylan/chitin deacetylase (PgdA/CDA1 family)